MSTMSNGSERYDRDSRSSRERDDNNDLILTVRVLMHGKEVGSIIGKKGELVRQLREQSGSRIHISDGSSADRIVTVTGNLNSIYKAFTLITAKVQEFFERQNGSWGGMVAPLVFKLIVPATQCGSIIGKGGSKIKEIRESSGASIQVASDMLPNSTERTVTITGNPETITQCIYQVCLILMESPPRGTVVPYRPKSANNQGFLAGGLQGGLGLSGLDQLSKLGAANPLASLASLSSLAGLGGLSGLAGGGLNAAALAAIASSQLRGSGNKKVQSTPQTQEITVPNEYIGCIIGKGGSKIAEIRQISGAVIRISSNEETREGPDGIERPITIQGTPDAITVAKYLINMSVDLQKANLEAQNQSNSGGSSSSSGNPSPLASALPLAQLLSKPGALNALSSLSALGGLTDLLGNVNNAASRPVQTTGVHRSKSYSSRVRSPSGDKSKMDRNKFAPY
ncbi:poly(rC)-binding protein 3-like isoform X1 [Planococcus citri]|uniref:poly(rC)-binding protein 3-like isoform X1 n=1 Tax=Planococcus citri TaxID=170843 RepID=UPI0031F9776F